jgi:uncharacterized protein (DUF4415 family)
MRRRVMKKDENIRRYSAEELRELRRKEGSSTDWDKVHSVTDEELECLIAEDEDERDIVPDWTRARLVMPARKRSVNLRLEPDIIEFFKAEGEGHIRRMQAVLRAYVHAHKRERQR